MQSAGIAVHSSTVFVADTQNHRIIMARLRGVASSGGASECPRRFPFWSTSRWAASRRGCGFNPFPASVSSIPCVSACVVRHVAKEITNEGDGTLVPSLEGDLEAGLSPGLQCSRRPSDSLASEATLLNLAAHTRRNRSERAERSSSADGIGVIGVIGVIGM